MLPCAARPGGTEKETEQVPALRTGRLGGVGRFLGNREQRLGKGRLAPRGEGAGGIQGQRLSPARGPSGREGAWVGATVRDYDVT